MANIMRTGGSSAAITGNVVSAEVGVSGNFGQTITANSGLVGAKKKA